ncbi:MAG: glycoside hydrolase family 95 protein [Muribaculaceae bacterium]|nr:glycoside hydrolase family 95 protein [Muribaculaceae bacterium]
MKPIKILLCAAIACALASEARDASQTISFDSPLPSDAPPSWRCPDGESTRRWERESLPIGNSAFGASILGSVKRDRLVLNEKSLWHGGPATGDPLYRAMNRQVPDSMMPAIRALLSEGRHKEADALLAENFRGNIPYNDSSFGGFTVLGEAVVTSDADEGALAGYSRSLLLDSALTVVRFEAAGKQYDRRYYASYPDSVMVITYSCSAPQSLTFALDTPNPVDSVTGIADGIVYHGHLKSNGMRWALAVSALASDGGTVTPSAERASLSVEGARDVTFLLAAATDYRMNFEPDFSDPLTFTGSAPAPRVTARINAARERADSLYSRHLADYSGLYGRVKLSLGQPQASSLTTPERLEAYRRGAADTSLEELYFNYGRYLLIASSRPGTLPANLQGLWSDVVDGPWHVDYHNNINVQMNYWPATSTNLLECFEPYTDYIRSLVVPGAATARETFGASGWTASISANPFGFTAPLDSRQMEWNYNPSAGAWLASQLWDYYLFTGDTEWLRTIAYPIIRGSAAFTADMLAPLPDGTLSCSPSYSPEHGTISAGTGYANALAREILGAAVEAARILGTDTELRDRWAALLPKITPYNIGRHGQLCEWLDDIDDPADRHRHTNHLFGLHPGSSITHADTALIEACKTTLRQRGDEATGWSMGWKLNHWARLHDGDHAYTLFRNLLSLGTADNLWDMHPPFQIDGNFGGTAGVAEMLLQSHDGHITLLPALPAAWPDGKVEGLLARTGIEVDIEWEGGALTQARLTSAAGASCTLRYAGSVLPLHIEPGATATIVLSDGSLKHVL